MKRARNLWIALALFLVLGVVATPGAIRLYWSARSSNPVRRGVVRAQELGCFTCHGPQGTSGIADPGIAGVDIPAWSGGVWMMYVKGEGEIHEFILDGVSARRAASSLARQEREAAAVQMPAYRSVLRGTDLEDLTAAFVVLSGMNRPSPDSSEGRGYDLARRWGCFSCHGPGASGGVRNSGSFAGFIPGWYGPDFRDLVRSREEFDAWVRDGWIDRLAESRVASYFVGRQRILMPFYQELTADELDDLWAYARWLDRTGGGIMPSGPQP
jgi:hypothetical protein